MFFERSILHNILPIIVFKSKEKALQMHISFRYVLWLCLLALCFSCAKRERVALTVDFSARPNWLYDFEVSVGGKVAMGDSVSHFSNALRCRLSGTGDSTDPAMLKVIVQSIDINESAQYKADAINMKHVLEDFEIAFSLREGFVGIDDSAALPAVKTAHWDLYRHFIKMLPLLPDGQVSEGFTWERQKQIPLPTNHGDAVGHLYQSFRFDSLTKAENGHRHAHLSWSFNYSVDTQKNDSLSLLDDMPHSGRGKGSAVLDVTAKTLREASVSFTIPEAGSSDLFKVEWQEEARIALKE